MKKIIIVMPKCAALPRLILALLLAGAGLSANADFDEGVAAYEKGDYATALREWQPLAEQGNAFAQFNLGAMYAKGQGVPQDDKAAAQWYRRAAEQGNARAQNNLGMMYIIGQGVLQDYAYAHMWANIAASGGDKNSVEFRNLVEKQMTPSQIAEAQKLARECVRKAYKDC